MAVHVRHVGHPALTWQADAAAAGGDDLNVVRVSVPVNLRRADDLVRYAASLVIPVVALIPTAVDGGGLEVERFGEGHQHWAARHVDEAAIGGHQHQIGSMGPLREEIGD